MVNEQRSAWTSAQSDQFSHLQNHMATEQRVRSACISAMSRPGIEPLTSGSPERTLYRAIGAGVPFGRSTE